MLVIRFYRVGKRNQPSFKIVVTDKRKSSKCGRSTEEVGFWNPATKEKSLKIERIKYWISAGAQPSPTVHNLLVREKIISGGKIAIKIGKPKAEKKEETKAPEAKPAEVPNSKTRSSSEMLVQAPQAENAKPKIEVLKGESKAESAKEELRQEEPKEEPAPETPQA